MKPSLSLTESLKKTMTEKGKKRRTSLEVRQCAAMPQAACCLPDEMTTVTARRTSHSRKPALPISYDCMTSVHTFATVQTRTCTRTKKTSVSESACFHTHTHTVEGNFCRHAREKHLRNSISQAIAPRILQSWNLLDLSNFQGVSP